VLQALIWAVLAAAVITSTSVAIARHLASTGADLTTEQRSVLLKLESVLLHDTPYPTYGRTALEPGGRGILAGIGDFATADGSVLRVVDAYVARVGPNRLSQQYRPALALLAEAASPETTGLEGFADAWRTTARDPAFRQAQDSVLGAEFLQPAMDAARAEGVRSALGIAVFFDTLLQHGDAGDADSLGALVARTNARGPRAGAAGTAEKDWVVRFLDVRTETLLDPARPGRAQLWPLTIGRVQVLSDLAQAGDWDLSPPVVVSPYGTTHSIDATPPRSDAPDEEPGAAVPPTRNPDPGGSTSPQPRGSQATSPAGPTGTNPPAPSSTVRPRLEGIIVGIAGLCLESLNARFNPGNHVQAYPCNGTQAQYWVSEPDESLSITIVPADHLPPEGHTVCVGVMNNVSLPGTPVEIQNCAGNAHQRWRFENGRIRNLGADRCLSTPGDTTEPGNQLVLATCADRPGQYWSLPRP
jgi:chitosanase